MTYLHSFQQLDMEGIHPTLSGTLDFLLQMDKQFQFITNQKFITDKKLYRGCESVFKYGCLFCHQYLQLDNRSLCPKCSPSWPRKVESASNATSSVSLQETPGAAADGDVTMVSPVFELPVHADVVHSDDHDMERLGRKRGGSDASNDSDASTITNASH